MPYKSKGICLKAVVLYRGLVGLDNLTPYPSPGQRCGPVACTQRGGSFIFFMEGDDKGEMEKDESVGEI